MTFYTESGIIRGDMEMLRFPSHRGFSVRSIFGFVLAVVVTALLWTTLSSSSAFAADASWQGDLIVTDGRTFAKSTDLKDSSGTLDPKGTVYQAPVQQPGVEHNNTNSPRLLVLYFAPGVDPPTATTVTYYEFKYDEATKTVSDPTGKREVSLSLPGEEEPLSACSVAGIGWIVCPVSVFIAEGMDWLFGILQTFLTVTPLTINDPTSGMYIAWNIMRNIANVAFVVAFLIIIYAQITGGTLSNYSIKKLLPRLIVAAVLVNVSFIVSALAIDLSNIAGRSIQEIFTAIGRDIFHVTNDDLGGFATSPWGTLTNVVLAGAGVIGGIWFVASGAYFLLAPILVGAALTVLFVVIVFAARQAIIIIMVIVSPLAFVANLLPNTEDLYKKWQGLFSTMLIFFPAFSLVYGGSQLAGQVVIQNAGESIVMLIFGLAVQVAPLVITPLILKFSGGLLGKIAQIANNPNKGRLDRSRKWADESRQMHRNKVAGKNLDSKSKLNPLHYGTRMVKSSDFRQRKRKMHMENAEQLANAEANKAMATDGTSLNRTMVKLEGAKVNAELEVQRAEVVKAEYRAGGRVIDPSDTSKKAEELRNAQTKMAAHVMEMTASKRAADAANNTQQQEYAKAMKDNIVIGRNGETLRQIAGGIQGHVGEQRAFAQAISEQHKAHGEMIANANAILDDFNLDAAANLSIAKNIKLPNVNLDITPDIQEAAIKRVASNGVIPHIEELMKTIDLSPSGNEDYRTAFVEALKGNSGRPKFIGFGTMDKITQGIPGGVNDSTIDGWIEGMLLEDKLSAKELASQDKDTLIRIKEAIPRLHARTDRTAQEQVLYYKSIANLKKQIASFRDDKDLINMAGERVKVVDLMEDIL